MPQAFKTPQLLTNVASPVSNCRWKPLLMDSTASSFGSESGVAGSGIALRTFWTIYNTDSKQTMPYLKPSIHNAYVATTVCVCGIERFALPSNLSHGVSASPPYVDYLCEISSNSNTSTAHRARRITMASGERWKQTTLSAAALLNFNAPV